MALVTALVLAALWSAPSATSASGSAPSPGLAPSLVKKCVTDSQSADALNAFFYANNAAGLSGEDYPHAYDLPGANTLWMFQDAYRGADANLVNDGFGHNLGLIQRSNCFSGPLKAPSVNRSWLGAGTEIVRTRWLWPLDGAMGADGNFHLFMVRMYNSNRTGAASGALPRETWEAVIRPSDLRILSLGRAKIYGTRLYGYSIVEDDDYTYMYGYCYKQFDPKYLLGANPCESDVYVARVDKGQFRGTYKYWDGDSWTTDAGSSRPVMDGRPSRQINPPSVRRFGDVYVNASKEGDWWGTRLFIDVAARPQGPWTQVRAIALPAEHGSDTTYGASIMPWLDPANGKMVIAHANFVWKPARAWRNGRLYRISFLNVAVPDLPSA